MFSTTTLISRQRLKRLLNFLKLSFVHEKSLDKWEQSRIFVNSLGHKRVVMNLLEASILYIELFLIYWYYLRESILISDKRQLCNNLQKPFNK